MNHIFATVWNHSLGAWVAASEHASRRGKRGTRRAIGSLPGITALGFALFNPAYSLATDLPTGGTVVLGSGTISSSTSDMVIDQASSKLAINWQSFDIGTGNSVTFNQPSSSSIALNRVLGSDGSSILGQLNANGRVFLINPNGILFGSGASVNVGALVASTLNITDEDFAAGTYSFKSDGANASVINKGSISAADGGAVALLGGTVSNQGTIVANLGTVALAAGNAVTLDFAGDGLLSVQVDEATKDALVENQQLIQADGGSVIMTAKASDALLQTVVNNTGVIEARTLGEKNGKIVLLGGDSGTVEVAGTLDASAPDGGDGGFVETSGAHVKVADGATVTTLAASGTTGEWLIDPTDFTIYSGAGDQTDSGIGADTLSDNLATTSVTLETVDTGSEDGDINVDAAVSWDADTTLTLDADNDINVNAAITANGASAGLVLNYGGDYNVNAAITFSNDSNTDGLSINGTAYTLIHSMAALDAIDSTGLSGDYALAEDLDASGTTYTSALVGTSSSAFTGTFAGLGHTISELTIDAGSTNFVGLFGYTGSGSVIRDIGLLGGSVTTTGSNVGGLVGYNGGSISNSYAEGDVSGVSNVGGLIGLNQGSNYTYTYSDGASESDTSVNISNSYATGSVTGSSEVGGLIGQNNYGNISNSYAEGDVSGVSNVGGLIGLNQGSNYTYTYSDGASESDTSGNISNSYATGDVTGTGNYVGGLIGQNNYGNISDSYAEGDVSGVSYVGGLVGTNQGSNYTNSDGGSESDTSGNISNSYATGSVTGSSLSIGGLIGYNNYGNISDSYAEGNVSGGSYVGGLVGYNFGDNYTYTSNVASYHFSQGNISGSYATGDVTSGGDHVGGLIGQNDYGNISDSSATGNVSGASYVGGLVGSNYGYSDKWTSDSDSGSDFVGVISASHATGNVTATGTYAGGLVGYNLGLISASWAEGAAKGVSYVGGLVGYNAGEQDTYTEWDTDSEEVTYTYNNSTGTISGSYATGSATATDASGTAGGLVGLNIGGQISGSYATGAVTGGIAGGLVGVNWTYSIDSDSDGSSYEYSYTHQGLIEDSYATGSVTAIDASSVAAGGLVGVNQGGQISGSYATGAVTGGLAGGGLVGANLTESIDSYVYQGLIEDSYATGSVTDSIVAGGLVGYNGGDIVNTYATGAVNTDSEDAISGGLVGVNDESGVWISERSGISYAYTGTITASFYNADTSDQTAGTGYGDANGVAGKTTVELSTLATFTDAGWDISANGGDDTVWRIYEGSTTPLLRSFLAPVTLTVDASAGSKTYDGSISSGTASYTADTEVDDELILGELTYASASKNAGTYSTAADADGQLSISGSLYSTQQGYDISYADTATSLVIGKASLIIRADDVSKTYGETVSLSGYKTEGLVEGDSVTSVRLASLGADAAAEAATYDIEASDAAGSGLSNYEIAYEPGQLTVSLPISDTDTGSDGGTGSSGDTSSDDDSGSSGDTSSDDDSGSSGDSGSNDDSGSVSNPLTSDVDAPRYLAVLTWLSDSGRGDAIRSQRLTDGPAVLNIVMQPGSIYDIESTGIKLPEGL